MRGKRYTVFVNRSDAGRQLVERLLRLKEYASRLRNNFDSNSTVVLAIPRGGVIVADVIASILGVKLDLVVSRKIGAPFNPEFAIGAVMPDGTSFLNAGAIEIFQVPEQYIATQVEEQMKEIDRRLLLYRGRRDYDNELEGKIVILVDDGVATGSTIYAAAQWVKAQRSGQLVIAVPVTPKETTEKLEVADIVVSLETPISFEAVGEFYQDFSQVTDAEVIGIMRSHGYKSLNFKGEGVAA